MQVLWGSCSPPFLGYPLHSASTARPQGGLEQSPGAAAAPGVARGVGADPPPPMLCSSVSPAPGRGLSAQSCRRCSWNNRLQIPCFTPLP